MSDATTATRRVALSFMAHPDDAEILCGGTLIRLCELGWEVHIAIATPGDCGSATLAPEAIMAIRREEGRKAAATMAALRKVGYCSTLVAEMIPPSPGVLERTAGAMAKIARM